MGIGSSTSCPMMSSPPVGGGGDVPVTTPPATAAPATGGGDALAGIVTALQGIVQQLGALVAALQARGGAGLVGGGGPGQVPGQTPGQLPSSTAPDQGTPPGTPHVPTSAPKPPATKPPAPPAGGSRLGANDPVLVIGDSLTVGAGPGIKQDLGGHDVTVNARVGRPLAEGMAEYDKVANKPKVVEMGLGTNDDPTHVAQLQAAVQKTVDDAKARGGKVIWATIHRAPVGGHSYDAMNAMLRDMAKANPGTMGLVDWEAQVSAHPDMLAGDHIHGTTAGYAWRAQAYADAAKG